MVIRDDYSPWTASTLPLTVVNWGSIVGIILWLSLRVLSPSWLLNYKWFGLDATVIVGIIAFSVPFFVTCACQLCAAAEEAYDRKQEQLSDTRLRV